MLTELDLIFTAVVIGKGKYVDIRKKIGRRRNAALTKTINVFVLIDLTQHATKYSDCSGQSKKDLIACHATVEAEAERIQVGLQFGASAMIGARQEGFQITDCLVQPVKISSLVLFRLPH